MRVRSKIPLLNGGRVSPAAVMNFSQHADRKPERKLGAPFIDNLIQQGGNCLLCELCWRRYGGWYKRYGLRPNWDMRLRGNCDGCSTRMVPCVHFVPEERFFKVYTPSHGRYPAPDKTLYFV